MSRTEYVGILTCNKKPCPDREAGLRHATSEWTEPPRDHRLGAEGSVNVMMLTFNPEHHDVRYMSRTISDWTPEP